MAGENGRWHDLRPVTADIDPAFLGGDGVSWARAALDGGELPLAEEPGRFGPPLAPTGKIVCVGLNYSDHAAETGADALAEPILFMKAADTVVGPADDVLIPRGSVKTDYEVELAVVIGREGRLTWTGRSRRWRLSPRTRSATTCSERDLPDRARRAVGQGQELRDVQPAGAHGWSPPTWCPTRSKLGLRLSVNGELRQDSSTEQDDLRRAGTWSGTSLGFHDAVPR